jgi:hypothetical protein
MMMMFVLWPDPLFQAMVMIVVLTVVTMLLLLQLFVETLVLLLIAIEKQLFQLFYLSSKKQTQKIQYKIR